MTEPELTIGSVDVGESMTAEDRLDLNRADESALQTLPGVGPSVARRIVRGRPYESVEDLLRVAGVGQRLLGRIESLVYVATGPSAAASETASAAPAAAKQRTESTTLLVAAATAAVSVALSVGLTLAVLLAINGTLNVGRHANIRALGDSVRMIQAELTDLDARLNEIDGRLGSIEGLNERMGAVEADTETLQQDVERAQEQVGAMAQAMREMQSTVNELARRSNRFEMFLDGLRALLETPGADESQNGASP